MPLWIAAQSCPEGCPFGTKITPCFFSYRVLGSGDLFFATPTPYRRAMYSS